MGETQKTFRGRKTFSGLGENEGGLENDIAYSGHQGMESDSSATTPESGSG